MEEDKNLWNKTSEELTVGDIVVITALTPIIMAGGLVVVGAVLTAADKIVKKFRKTKPELKIVTDEEN
jgi:hypothetical protein